MNAEQLAIAYPIIQSIFDGQTARQTGVNQLHEQLALNKSSAKYLVEVYGNLRKGTVFKRALSNADMSYFLERIGVEGGFDGLSKAIVSLTLHIAYRQQSGISQRSNLAILGREKARLANWQVSLSSSPSTLGQLDEAFLSEVQKSLQDSEASRRRRLTLAPKTPRRVARMIYVYERNADVVAEVLGRAAGICARCGSRAPFARKTDGSPYLEVHHVVPLAEDGEDSIANAIALCPNCHRYNHHGRVDA